MEDAIEVDVVDKVESAELPKEEQQKEEKVGTAERAKAIVLSKEGLLAPKDAQEEWRVADMMLKSGALPQQYQNVPQVVVALQFLKEHRLPPMVAIRQCTIINGTLSIWGDLPKALCDRSKLMMGFEEFVFDKNYTPICFKNKNLDSEIFGAYCRVSRKDRADVEQTFTFAEARAAALLGKGTWKSYPRRMIQMRARSLALKDQFPDVLMGIGIAEYDYDQLPGGAPAEKPMEMLTAADEVNKAYGSEKSGGTE